MKTGKHSINNRIHGNIRALEQQQSSIDKLEYGELKELLKKIAVDNGYNERTFKYKKTGKKYIVPQSLGGASNEQANILNQTIQEFADSYNLWLYEYDFMERKYKSIGGRTPEEMQRDFPEMDIYVKEKK